MFSIEERVVGEVMILDMSGKVQVGDAEARLRDKVNSVLYQGHRTLLLNLAGVSAVDSTGIGALMAARSAAERAGGQLRLVNLTTRIRDLLVIAGLLSHFPVDESEEAALQASRQPAGSGRCAS